MASRHGACLVLFCLAGCAAAPDSGALVDPLKQRLIAREDIALQNLLIARTPVYAAGGDDVPYYDGPVIEPPLPEPDLNLLPEDLPPWDDLAPETGGQ